MNVYLWMLGGWELLIVGLIIILFFGGKRIPEMMRGLGSGIREFKDASREEPKDSKTSEIEENQPPKNNPPK